MQINDTNILMGTNYTNNDQGDKLIFPKLSYELNGIFFKIHNDLGRYSREKQYCDEIEKRLKVNNISFSREFKINDSGNIADFVIDNKILLEIKAKPILLKTDYNQTQRYLQALNLRLGLLVNFRNRFLKPARIVKIDTQAKDRFLL